MSNASERDRSLLLVVDDDFGSRLLVVDALEQAGFEVVEAGDGEEGLQVFQERGPDMVLMDVVMPGIDGYAACEALRRTPEGAHLPVLMMTGLDDTASIQRAYAAGATDFITKPINYVLLGHRVRYLLRASRAIGELAQSQRRLANAQRIARLGYWDWSSAGRGIRCSEEAARIIGLCAGESLSCLDDFLRRIPENERPGVRAWFEDAAVREGASSVTHHLERADGEECFVRQQAESTPVDGRGMQMHGTLQDITDLHRAEQRIHRLAFYDSLTGLPNREYFRDQVALALRLAERHGHQMALLFLDLNNFKRINDTLGHNIGDLLLRETAARLLRCIRASDVIAREGPGEDGQTVARLGGDEFTLLLQEVRRAEDASRVAERVIETLSRPLTLDGHEVFITPSIGIAVYPQDGTEADELLKNADMAMFYAKRSGQGHYQFYDGSMNEVARKRLAMEMELRRALERGELSVHYQPQMDALSGEVCGLEALLRWRNAKLGSVSPVEFIPLAEETGLIIPIGEWVIRTTCKQATRWRAQGLAVPRVAVNVSAVQFMRPGFVEVVRAALQESGLEPEALELEVTESLLMKDAEYAVTVLTALKGLGTQLAIDDFGTGYSSLSYLKRFPIDRLKIDRAFVQNINTDPDDAAIAEAVIGMASSMELRVLAEGVEETAQLRMLQEKHCDEVQGYLLSRPLPSQDVPAFLDRHQQAVESDGGPARTAAGVEAVETILRSVRRGH